MYIELNAIDLAIFLKSYWKREAERWYYMVAGCSLRRVPQSSLHSLSVRLFCCDSLRALVSHSPTTVAHLSSFSLPIECDLCSLGCKMETRGLSHYLSQLPPCSLFLSVSVLHVAVVSTVLLVSPGFSLDPLQTFLPPSSPFVFGRTVLWRPRWAH